MASVTREITDRVAKCLFMGLKRVTLLDCGQGASQDRRNFLELNEAIEMTALQLAATCGNDLKRGELMIAKMILERALQR